MKETNNLFRNFNVQPNQSETNLRRTLAKIPHFIISPTFKKTPLPFGS
jgi:hypothetical protein